MTEPASPSVDALSWLREVETRVTSDFTARRHVLSYDQFLRDVVERPEVHVRTVATYVRRCLDHYGTTELSTPQGGALTRWNLFDCPWDDGRDRVVGQEAAQAELHRLLVNFERQGRVTRLVLLHGPNGSAKSSLLQAIQRALEHYSTLDEGALYRFNWVFPSTKIAKKRLGFGDSASRPAGQDSYALLDDDDVDARLPGDLRDHPLLVLPREDRRALIDRLVAAGQLPAAPPVGDYLLDGDLSPRSKAIAEALLTAYQGDFQRVLQHVQVERYYISRRYRSGAVTVEPQMHVDASLRQVTMDQGFSSLPPTLRTLTLYEPMGDLVDANRGVLEFNDLLKKPLESYKYLLATCEKGTVSLAQANLHVDTLFLASSNEAHLAAFKDYQDFPSFKGRLDLVKMGYLRDHRVERQIYEEHAGRSGMADNMAPHTTYVLALWATLTRMHPPEPAKAPESLRGVLGKLTPMQKAELYAGEREPEGLPPEKSRDLWAYVTAMLDEGQAEADYEGSFGASPRVMKQVMLHALQSPRHPGLSPMAVATELRELVKQTSVYDFLKRKTVRGFFDPPAFIDQVLERYLDRVDDDVRTAMGLVSSEQYEELFARYILHVSYALKRERLYNEKTGRAEEPDAGLMKRLEDLWDAPRDRDTFRRELVGRVGAWRVDHVGEPIAYRRLFPKLIGALEHDYHRKQRDTVGKLGRAVLDVLAMDSDEPSPSGSTGRPGAGLDDDRVAEAREVVRKLRDDHGYEAWAQREALNALIRGRYAD